MTENKVYCAFSVTEQGTPQNQARYQKENSLSIILIRRIKVNNAVKPLFKKRNFLKEYYSFTFKNTHFVKRTFIKMVF